MNKQPLYNSSQGQTKRPQRRRIGELSKSLRNELKALTPHELMCAKIAASLIVVGLSN